MHLLAATSGVIGDGEEAVDLDQPPGDILILSAADSELAALSAAHAALRMKRRQELPSLRLASLLALRHNMSVDLWIDKTARHARIIIARVLGGRAYWSYGVDELHALAKREGVHLVLLPLRILCPPPGCGWTAGRSPTRRRFRGRSTTIWRW